MTFNEFKERFEWLEHTYAEYDLVESGKKEIELCRRFFIENRNTMNDRELEQMLLKYVQCLNGYPDDNAELGRIVLLREKVCRRLAKQSFEDYGEEWAGAMYDKAFHGQMPDSLADYDACIAIWERVIQELGRKRETSLASCCFHAAVDCEYHKLYEKAFEYIERALGIYQKEGNLARYDILCLGQCQKIAANALTKLGRYDEAEERLEKAEETLLEWSNMHENAGCTVTRNYFMGDCNDIRDEIRKHRENKGKNTIKKKQHNMENTKVILIPDLHGRMFWKKAVANADDATRIIFLGDYTDPYGFEEITPKEAFDNFVAVLEYARSHPNVELLLGNHDCGYLFGEEVCRCRTDEDRYAEIRQLFLDNLDLFKFCTEAKVDGRRYLVSHAGINRQWLEAHAGEFFPDGEIDYETLSERVNRYFIEEPMDYNQTALLSEVGRHRGGIDPYSSIVWTDIDEFDDDGVHLPVDQIVGHTLQVFEEFNKEDYALYYGGACIKNGPQDTVYCIDTAEAYYLDEKGVLRYMRNDKRVDRVN